MLRIHDSLLSDTCASVKVSPSCRAPNVLNDSFESSIQDKAFKSPKLSEAKHNVFICLQVEMSNIESLHPPFTIDNDHKSLIQIVHHSFKGNSIILPLPHKTVF